MNEGKSEREKIGYRRDLPAFKSQNSYCIFSDTEFDNWGPGPATAGSNRSSESREKRGRGLRMKRGPTGLTNRGKRGDSELSGVQQVQRMKEKRGGI